MLEVAPKISRSMRNGTGEWTGAALLTRAKAIKEMPLEAFKARLDRLEAEGDAIRNESETPLPPYVLRAILEANEVVLNEWSNRRK